MKATKKVSFLKHVVQQQSNISFSTTFYALFNDANYKLTFDSQKNLPYMLILKTLKKMRLKEK